MFKVARGTRRLSTDTESLYLVLPSLVGPRVHCESEGVLKLDVAL